MMWKETSHDVNIGYLRGFRWNEGWWGLISFSFIYLCIFVVLQWMYIMYIFCKLKNILQHCFIVIKQKFYNNFYVNTVKSS